MVHTEKNNAVPMTAIINMLSSGLLYSATITLSGLLGLIICPVFSARLLHHSVVLGPGDGMFSFLLSMLIGPLGMLASFFAIGFGLSHTNK
jgi:hypothetical protein